METVEKLTKSMEDRMMKVTECQASHIKIIKKIIYSIIWDIVLIQFMILWNVPFETI